MKTEKKCRGCKQVKDLTLFEKDHRNPDGRGARCYECKNEASKRTKALRANGIYLSKRESPRIKASCDIELDPYDPDLELKNRAKNWLRRYGNAAYVKARLI